MSGFLNTGSTGEDSVSPPVLKSWARLYGVVLGELALLIILFHLFSQYYR